jgi:hypothetical protein
MKTTGRQIHNNAGQRTQPGKDAERDLTKAISEIRQAVLGVLHRLE